MTQTEALRLALEALECAIGYTSCPSWSPSMTDECKKAITAVKAALANEALERKAKNARELGLDYEPDAQKESVRLQCTTCGTVYAEGVPPQVQQPAALEAKDEPVAWKLVPIEPTDEMLKAMDECSTEGYDERLYAGHAASVYMAAVDVAPAPPKRKPLSDDEIVLIIADCAASHQHLDIHLARAIEAAHGIKGEA
jgi:hypothetical protein